MKKINILLLMLLLSSGSVFAQIPYNPFTQNIHFAPEPTVAGFQCGTTQTVVFTQGLTTADDATQWSTDPLTVTICLGGFQFNGSAASVVSGSYASNFNWAYSVTSPNCIIGIQNQTLVGTGSNPIFPNPLSSGNIQLSLLVPSSSAVSTILSVDVTLQVPAYMATFNSAPDDNESTQTQTFCDCYVLNNPGAIVANQIFCGSGNPAIFNSLAPASGGSGGNILYQWQELIGATWTDISGETLDTYDAPTTSVTKQYRRNSKRSLCGDWINSNALTVTINALPIANAGLDKNINCLISSTTIGSSAIPGNTYSWSPSTGLNSSSIAEPIANPTSTTSYTVTVTGANGCASSDIVIVNVNNTVPTANAGIDKNLNCNNSSSTIGTFATVGNSYSWSPVLGLNLNNVAQPTANPNVTTTYTLTVTNVNGCVASDVVIINVDNTPPIANTGTAKSLCNGDSLILGTPAIVGNTYLWGPSIGLSSIIVAQPLANPIVTTTYTLTVTSTSNGCTATDVVTVSVDTCLIDISGTVYNDTNALTNLNVDGIGISAPGGTLLYANLVDLNGNVLSNTSISIDGTYLFTNVPTNQTYVMVLSTTQGTVGTPSPIANLPGTWVNTGEDCCDQVGDDGNPDGKNTFAVTNFTKTNVDFGIKDPLATSLPVVLQNFYVVEYNCEGLLTWITLQEQNTLKTDVYRRDGGKGAFRKIATVESAGNSTEKKVYNYIDKNVAEGTNYEYQLKFVDIDGQYSVSDIKTMNLDCSKNNTVINVFPNPAINELNVVYVTEEDNIELTVEIVDIAGRKLFSKSQVMNNGGNLISFDLSSLASGHYILHYKDVDGLTEGSQKFVKQ